MMVCRKLGVISFQTFAKFGANPKNSTFQPFLSRYCLSFLLPEVTVPSWFVIVLYPKCHTYIGGKKHTSCRNHNAVTFPGTKLSSDPYILRHHREGANCQNKIQPHHFWKFGSPCFKIAPRKLACLCGDFVASPPWIINQIHCRRSLFGLNGGVSHYEVCLQIRMLDLY